MAVPSQAAQPAQPSGRVICVGDAMIDLVAVLPRPLVAGSDTPAEIRVAHGGSAANTAAWLAFIGTPSAFVGRVGADSLGRDFVHGLIAAGVSVQAAVDQDRPTGSCIVLVAPDGERTMVPSAGANAALSEADVDAIQFSDVDRLHLSAYPLLRPSTRAVAIRALQRAASAGVQVSVDVASAAPLATVGAEAFLALLQHDVLLLANAAEAAVLADTGDASLAAARLSTRFGQVVIKCGGLGAVLGIAGTATKIAGSAAAVVDSTGAGDAFAAGLLAALMSGQALDEAAAQGNLLGARAVSQPGARPPDPPKAD